MRAWVHYTDIRRWRRAVIANYFVDPNGVTVDANDNVYFSGVWQFGGHAVAVFPASGFGGYTTLIAGNYNTSGFSGDGGPATAAELNNPGGLAVDAAGNLYIADTGNNVIRKVDPSGTITTVAGAYPGGTYSGDGGPATDATLAGPTAVAVDSAGNLYIADTGNCFVRKVDSSGIITTIAGNYVLGSGYSGDGGPATEATLDEPSGLAVDSAGNLYIADVSASNVRKVDVATGRICAVAAFGGNYGGGFPALISLLMSNCESVLCVSDTVLLVKVGGALIQVSFGWDV